MTILTELTKPALRKQMRKLEKAILKVKTEFLSNEVNDAEHLDKHLEDMYFEIEPIYTEIKRRCAKPLEVTIPSKMNADSEPSKEPAYQWELKGGN